MMSPFPGWRLWPVSNVSVNRGQAMMERLTFPLHGPYDVSAILVASGIVAYLTSFNLEEIDWTSYYYCIRFPVADPTAVQTPKRIWRRRHIEGPINDT
jgi:hypothetical protein